MSANPLTREHWPHFAALLDDVAATTEKPHVIATGTLADPAHVEKVVDRRLAEHKRAQDIEDRMHWQ